MSDASAHLKNLLEDRLAVLVWWPRAGGFASRVRELRDGLRREGVDLCLEVLHRRAARASEVRRHHAAVLPHLEQVHVDLSSELLRKRFAVRDWHESVELSYDLVRRATARGPPVAILVDHSAGRVEGPSAAAPSVAEPGQPWWLEDLIGRRPDEVANFDLLGQGVGVALVDFPPDPGHPALRGKVAPALDAWAMPHYPRPDPVWDDHGTGSAGLVCGWESTTAPTGVAPAAHLHPVHLWPTPAIAVATDRVRILCRALELIRQRQLEPGGWAPIQVISQQYTLRRMRSGAGPEGGFEVALRVLEAAYARAAGSWALVVLVSAGSDPRALWPIVPAGLAGVTPVGAVSLDGEYVRRSARLGVELAVAVSNDGTGVWSAAAGGGYVMQGMATSAACPLAAGAVSAAVSAMEMEPRRVLRLIRRRGQVLPGGATKAKVGWMLRLS